MSKIDAYSLDNYAIDGPVVPENFFIKPAVWSGVSTTLNFTYSDGSQSLAIQYFTCDFSDLKLSKPPRMIFIIRNLDNIIYTRNFITSYLEGMKYNGIQIFATNYTGASLRISPNAYVTASGCRLAGSNDSYGFTATPEAYAYIIP
ncbi:hypothetical protein HW560_32075 [Paenibacillus sp. E222]|uniref:hypothetical protein n=1 Tax=Paenibacillus sp. E222 TaxID=2748863 RepID=UPI0015C608F1|nr:hypothetical protein [Paenibacillus sp. E222]QLG42296.1 hypothetical protein HW560_32075 [Paenibacillus sp. E222]